MSRNILNHFILIFIMTVFFILLQFSMSMKTVYSSTTNLTDEKKQAIQNSDSDFIIVNGEELKEDSNIYKADVCNNTNSIKIKINVDLNIDNLVILGENNVICGKVEQGDPVVVNIDLNEGYNKIKFIDKSSGIILYEFDITYKNIGVLGLSENITTDDSYKLFGLVDNKKYDNVVWSNNNDSRILLSKDGTLKPLKQGTAIIYAKLYDEKNEKVIGDLECKFYISGENRTGWVKNLNDWYYIDAQNGRIHTGWLKFNNQWYYFDNEGKLVRGWFTLEKNRYYSLPTGNMAKGFFEYDSKKYYSTEDGIVKIGWFKKDGNWYCADDEGNLKTGWIKDHGNLYYLDEDGKMQTSDKVIDGKIYRFNNYGELQV